MEAVHVEAQQLSIELSYLCLMGVIRNCQGILRALLPG